MENRSISERNGRNWRPQYHFTASRGWINDPNGLIFFKGWYHLFYQWNPNKCEWGSMHWGHAVSKDMIHWKDLPVALAPDQPYDTHPKGGCFSGSAVEKDGRLYLFYTAVSEDEGIMKQTQCMAVSEDGIHFRKLHHNPVIGAPPEGSSEDFRDPKVFEHDKVWYMVVGGSAGGAERGGDGRIFLYKSINLYQWEYCGVLLESGGRMGTMFECPDMFCLDGKWIVTCSPMYHPDYLKALYCIGEMDFEKCSYRIERIGNLDYGFDYYAPQSFLDAEGNRVSMAWQNGWLWMPWCKGFGPTERENWRGTLTIPRKITLKDENGLQTYPVAQVNTLMEHERTDENIEIREDKYFLKIKNPKCFYLKLSLQIKEITSMCLEVGVCGREKRGLILYIDLLERIMTLDRSCADDYGDGKMNCTFEPQDGMVDIDIFVDYSSVEVYINQGEGCITANIYPEEKQRECWLRTPYKSAVIYRIEYGSMKSIWDGEKSTDQVACGESTDR